MALFSVGPKKMCDLSGGTKDEKREKKLKKMDRFRRLPKSLLESISSRGQTSSPQEAPQKSSTSKKDAAARNALIAGAIGGGYTALATMGNDRLTVADKAVMVAQNAALLAGAAGTYTASEGSVLARAAKGLGAGVLGSAAVSTLGQLSGVNPFAKPTFGERARPYV